MRRPGRPAKGHARLGARPELRRCGGCPTTAQALVRRRRIQAVNRLQRLPARYRTDASSLPALARHDLTSLLVRVCDLGTAGSWGAGFSMDRLRSYALSGRCAKNVWNAASCAATDVSWGTCS